MTDPSELGHQSDYIELDLAELWSVLWSGRVLIAAVTALFAVVSVIYSLSVTEIFRAEALLVPAAAEESSSPLAGQLGGAAALVGINLGQSGGGRVNSVLATLRSREFILKFIRDRNLQDQLIPGLEDDQASDWRLYRQFNSMLRVSRESDTGLLRIGIEWPDPQQAADWVNLLVNEINAHEKARDVEEATNAIAYLQQQLKGTQLVEMQKVFYQLIESQTRVVMLADVRDEYVFRFIDPAVVPDERISPKRKAMVVTATLVGAMLATIYVIFSYLIVERAMLSRFSRAAANRS